MLITSNLTRAMKPYSTTRTIFSRYASAATTRLSNEWRRAERLQSSIMKVGLSGNSRATDSALGVSR
ncbi:putative holin [Klebsiella pneumoniae JHCK1]|nr:putative holin [Klebsiella pneumoniae JHCK1]